MRRIGAHYLYINATTQLNKGVVEINENGIIDNFFSLNDTPIETSYTEFYTGILSPAFFSLSKKGIENSTNKCSYTNLSISSDIPLLEKKFILDFEDLSLSEILAKLFQIQEKNPQLNIFDLLNGCSYFPENIVNNDMAGIKIGKESEIWLFENVDLINKKILPETTIRII